MMKDANISKAILSISTPGTYLRPFDAALTKEVTRTTNEELSEVCKAYPQYFRFFASLPLPNVEDCLAEIDYAIDTLGAVGFCVLSNANGVYMGDKSLDAVFDKLNERNAIIFTHPTGCKLVSGDHNHDEASGAPMITEVNPLTIPTGLLEYMFDETRAVANLLVSGTVTRCPNIQFIMSHAGCVLPSLLARIATAMRNFFGGGMTDDEMRRILRERFHFDLAGVPWPDMIHPILRIAGPERLVYGSDYCWTTPELVMNLIKTMDEGAKDLWTEETTRAVYSGNAKKLLKL